MVTPSSDFYQFLLMTYFVSQYRQVSSNVWGKKIESAISSELLCLMQANVTYYLLDNYLSINSIKDNLAKQTCSFGQTKLF